MIDINAILLSDTYKQVHNQMYPKGLTKLTSYLTPRKSMFENQDKVVFFGLQAFLQEFLVSYFNRNFFEQPVSDLLDSYKKYMNLQLGQGNYSADHLEKLHALGYLPLKIRALPEGSFVNTGVPVVEITNTHEDFAWLTQWIECILQTELWKPCNHATIGLQYLMIARKYYEKTTDCANPRMAMADFGMRGMSCTNESIRCSASWLLSFNKTSTIPALPYIDRYYDADCSFNHIGIGAASTEHSVMASNFAVDGDEAALVKRLLTEVYPETSFSMVSDTYDYWNMVENILPSLKKEIMEHKGKLLVRPDSGDQFETVIKTVQVLWEKFGGTENRKGYKVLDSHIGLILGDGCTTKCVEKIYRRLDEMKFAADNVVFGVGAFCFTATFEKDRMIVNTRDTFGVALKSTAGIVDGKFIEIFKDPKTDTENLKKSHRGIVAVYKKDGNYFEQDGFNYTDAEKFENEKAAEGLEIPMQTVFEDGRLYNRQNFMQIRRRLEEEVK